MLTTTNLTVSLTADVEQRLDRLAGRTHRTTSRIAADATAAYLDHESAIIEGIERGLSDMTAGRLVPHDEAMDRLEATIVRADQPKV